MDLEQKENEQIKITEVIDDISSSPEPQPEESGVVRVDPLIGNDFEKRYHIESLLGKGATSSVYKAVDRNKNSVVAIKILHSHLASDPTIAKRFKQEAKTSSLLQHPNIAEVMEYNKTESGAPYLVMEYVEGTSLYDAIQAAGWLPVSKVLTMSMQVCAALSAAHEKGIVHRDLKPSNIILSKGPDGNMLVKVLDFGIAKVLPAQGDTLFKLTQTGETLGSLLYMSPEQCLDQDVDARSDCYSLGCVMYEALTGKPPLAARTAFETMNKHMTDMPERLERVRPDVYWPDGLQELLFKALAKEPGQRYQRIVDLQDRIKSLSTGIGQPRKHEYSLSDDAIVGEKKPADYGGGQEKDNPSQGKMVLHSFDSVERFVETKRPRELAKLESKPPTLTLILMIVGLLVLCAVFPSPMVFIIAGSIIVICSIVSVCWYAFTSISAKAQAELTERYERLNRQLDVLRNAEHKPMLLTGGAWSLAPDSWTHEPIFIVDELKSREGEQAFFEGLKTIPVDEEAKIWDNIESLSQLGELAPPYALPLESEVYFDQGGKPIAICVKGKFALVL